MTRLGLSWQEALARLAKFRVYGDYCRFPPASPCRSWRPWRLPEELALFCRREHIELLDLTEPMRRAAAWEKLLNAAEDSHWSAEGHRFVEQAFWPTAGRPTRARRGPTLVRAPRGPS